jgi:AraC family transcriptional regulator
MLELVRDYMEAHLAEELPLADLATLTSLSAHHFGQAFKAATGLPPHQYVIQSRVARARELLRDPTLTIVEVAIMLGFSSQSHLTQHFRRLTGITPARFRRDLR